MTLKRAKRANKKIKKEIRRAIEQLPGLMVEHVKFKEIERPAEMKKLPAPERYDEIETRQLKALPYEDSGVIRQKKIWLWTGVTIFSAIVFLMWGWNMRSAFQDSFTNTKKQPSITNTAKTTWQDAIQTTQIDKPTSQPAAPKDNLDDLKSKIKNNLAGLLSTAANTTNTEPTN